VTCSPLAMTANRQASPLSTPEDDSRGAPDASRPLGTLSPTGQTALEQGAPRRTTAR